MSLNQKLTIMFFAFWLSFFIESLTLKFLLVLVFALYFHQHVPFLYFTFVALLLVAVLFIHSQTSFKDPFCGKVVDQSEQHVTLKNKHGQVSFFMDHDVNYFDKVCVSGQLKPYQYRSNFFTNPIDLWAKNKKHLGTLHRVKIVSHQRQNSIKGRLHRKLQDPSYHLVHDLIFKKLKVHAFPLLMIIFSLGLQYSAALQTLNTLFSRLMYAHSSFFVSLGLWLLFGLVWGFDFIWLRVALLFVFNFLFKDNIKARCVSYFILLSVYPNMATSTGFIFLVCLHFLIPKRTSVLRFVALSSLQHVFFYTSSLVGVVLFPVLVKLSGALFLISWVVALFPFLLNPYNGLLHVIINLFSTNTLSLVGYYPFIMVMVILLLMNNELLKGPKFALCLWGMCVYFAYYPLHDLVLYLNVGQADATLIKLAQGQGSMMFDVGRAQNVPLILNTLKALGIQHLDGIVISHDDSDHSGGLEDLTISMPKTIIHTEKKDIVFKRLYFQAFNQDYIGIDNNDDSVIGLVHLGRLKFLFMGDAGIMAEQHLIKSYPHLQVDVLKLGHHGSKTSTSSTFLASLQPTFGIISADRQVYGHPAPEVLRNLAQYQVTVLDTQVHGDLAFIRLFNQYFVITSAGYFGIIR